MARHSTHVLRPVPSRILPRILALAWALAAITPVHADSCDQAPTISEGDTLATIDGATAVTLPTGCPTNRIGRWFRFDVPDRRIVNVTLCNAPFAKHLSLTSTCPAAGGSCTSGSGACIARSQLNEPGPLYICVSGPAGSTGSFRLTVATYPEIQSDLCDQAAELPAPVDGRIRFWFDTRGAARDGAASCEPPTALPDRWFRFTSPQDVRFRIDAPPSTAVVSLHTACPGGPDNELTCSDGLFPIDVSIAAGQPAYLRVSPRLAAGAFGEISATVFPDRVTGADAIVPTITMLRQVAREGSEVALSADARLCNRGSIPIACFGNPDPRHPFFVANLYRLAPIASRPGATRFEQIGMSWAKHVLAGGWSNECGYGCASTGISPLLMPGCSDTYDATFNAEQQHLGPRSEINPWTGAFDFSTSILNQPLPPQTALSRRLRVSDHQIDSTLDPAADLFIEVAAVIAEDDDHLNTVAHRQVFASGAPGGTWSLALTDAAVIGPAILSSWPGAQAWTVPPESTHASADGRAIVAARITPNGDGTWHYEYAVLNFDMDRAVRAFRLALRPGAPVTSPAFAAPRSSEDPGFDNSPWSTELAPGSISWFTAPFGAGDSNPIRWASVYNFAFDCPLPPGPNRLTLGLYKPLPGEPDSIDAIIAGPALCPADFDLRGTVTVQDLFDFLIAYFQFDPRADLDASGAVTVQDLFVYLIAYFTPC